MERDPYSEARMRATQDPHFMATLRTAAERAMLNPTPEERRIAMGVAATAIVLWERHQQGSKNVEGSDE